MLPLLKLIRSLGAYALPRFAGYVTVRVAEAVAEPSVAVTVAEPEAPLAVFTVNVAEVPPAGMATEPGTLATAPQLRLTTTPPAGAGPVNLTVAVELFPAATDLGFSVNESKPGGVMVRFAIFETPFSVAIRVAVTCAETALVLMANDAEDLPPGMVTEDGTIASEVELESLKAIPPAGAEPLRVTNPVAGTAPATAPGLTPSETSTGGFTVSVALAMPAPPVAVIVTTFCEATPDVFAVKLPLFSPSGIMTEPGTETAPLLLDSRTLTPPFGARPFRVTVPADGVPPSTTSGLSKSESTPIGSNVRVADWLPLSMVPVIVAVVSLVTGVVETVNVAEDVCGAMATEAGTLASLELLDKLTIAPALPESPFRVTVPVDGESPATIGGFKVTDKSEAALMVSVCWNCPFILAVIAAYSVEATPPVATKNVALVCPLGTVTDDGIDAMGFEVVNMTVVPCGLAGPSKVRTPVDVWPPMIVVGLSVKDTNAVGEMVNVAD